MGSISNQFKLNAISVASALIMLMGCGDGGGGGLQAPSNAHPNTVSAINKLNSFQNIFNQKAKEILAPHGVNISISLSDLALLNPEAEPSAQNIKGLKVKLDGSLSESDLPKVKELTDAKFKSLVTSMSYKSDASHNIVLESSTSADVDVFQFTYFASRKRMLPDSMSQLATLIKTEMPKDIQNLVSVKESGDKIEIDGMVPQVNSNPTTTSYTTTKAVIQRNSVQWNQSFRLAGVESSKIFSDPSFIEADKVFWNLLESMESKDFEALVVATLNNMLSELSKK